MHPTASPSHGKIKTAGTAQAATKNTLAYRHSVELRIPHKRRSVGSFPPKKLHDSSSCDVRYVWHVLYGTPIYLVFDALVFPRSRA